MKYYQRRAAQHHIKKCCSCNETKILEVHHIDENRENDIVTNLCYLCPNCHSLYHYKNDKKVKEDILNYQEYFCDWYFSQEIP